MKKTAMIPEAQGVQGALPVAEQCPATQSFRHCDRSVAPVSNVSVPCGQEIQVLEPGDGWYESLGHCNKCCQGYCVDIGIIIIVSGTLWEFVVDVGTLTHV